MTPETARKAIETLMRILGDVHGVEIETIWRGKDDDERRN